MSTVLTNLINRKERLEEELRNVEKQVYDLETNYLHDSSAHGNVIKGFEGFLSANKTTNLKRARTFKTEDRLFSLSSLTSPAVEENLLGQVQEGLAGAAGYLPRSKSQTFTPSAGGYMMTKPMTLKRSRLARETKRRMDDDDEDFEL